VVGKSLQYACLYLVGLFLLMLAVLTSRDSSWHLTTSHTHYQIYHATAELNRWSTDFCQRFFLRLIKYKQFQAVRFDGALCQCWLSDKILFVFTWQTTTTDIYTVLTSIWYTIRPRLNLKCRMRSLAGLWYILFNPVSCILMWTHLHC